MYRRRPRPLNHHNRPPPPPPPPQLLHSLLHLLLHSQQIQMRQHRCRHRPAAAAVMQIHHQIKCHCHFQRDVNVALNVISMVMELFRALEMPELILLVLRCEMGNTAVILMMNEHHIDFFFFVIKLHHISLSIFLLL